jgi:magnesium transporter
VVTEVLYGLDADERERVAALREEARFFWLDVSLSETSRDEVAEALAIPDRVLRALSASHEAYPARTVHADGESVLFSVLCHVESKASADEAAYRLRPIEVQVLVTADYLLTLHGPRVSLPAILAPDLPAERSQRYVVYSVLDTVLASSFDALGEVELRLDSVAATWTDNTGVRVPRTTLRQAGARLASMRRRVGVEQAVFERAGVEIGALRGFDTDDEPYFDRLDEQLNRLVVSIDASANYLGMLLDLQLNERAYVVSVLAAIFVPLTFITGFFGMNFGWMVDQIDSPIAFWLFAFIVPIVTGVLAWCLVVRRFIVGDLGSGGSRPKT